jgi:cation:H+ antiporter
MIYVLFVIWFILLIKWADFLVDWASSIAKKLKISSLVIWLTIIAMGTSAPELVVNVMSALQWQTDLALWNILWSNSANILLILWLTAIIYPLTVKSSTVYKEIPFTILASIIILIVANDIFLDNALKNSISRTEWLVFLWFFIIFLVYSFSVAKSDKMEIKDTDEIITMSYWKSSLFIVLWIVGLAVGSKWIVDWAKEIATLFWISQTVIWLTVVAIWTSLPELITSIVAARKKEVDLGIWNIVWSNIFNTFMILGITAIINPVEVRESQFDILVNVIASILLFVCVFTWRKTFLWHKQNILDRKEWIILFSMYVIYMVYIVWITVR